MGKGIDRAHGNVTEESAGQAAVDLGLFIAREACMIHGGYVTWLGLAASYFPLRRASDRWAYADGKAHPEFCLTRSCLTLLRGELRVAFGNRASADAVQVRFVALKTGQHEGGVHNHADTPREPRGGGGRCDGRFRSFCWSSPLCTPRSRGVTPDGQVVPPRLENVHPDGSCSSVAPHDREERSRPGGATRLRKACQSSKSNAREGGNHACS